MRKLNPHQTMISIRFRSLLLLILYTCLGECMISQNVVFTLAENSPIYLNSAKTGEFVGNWRATTNYRTEGYGLSNPYISSIISYEHKFFIYSQTLNVGLFYINDNSASLSFPLNEIGLSLAQGVRVGTKSFIKLGLQFAFTNRSLNFSGESFPEQYDRENGYYNSLLPLTESFPTTSTSYFKLNAGALYSLKRDFTWTLGISGRQLNRPIESFFGLDEKLSIEWIIHTDFCKNIGTSFFMNPSAQYNYQNMNQIVVLNLGGGLYLPPNDYQFKSLNLGGSIRYGIDGDMSDYGVNIGFNLNNWVFTINHDFNLSSNKMNMAPSSAIELSLIYIRPSTEPKVRTISNQRF